MTRIDLLHDIHRAVAGIAAAIVVLTSLSSPRVSGAQGRNPGRGGGGESSPQRGNPSPQPSQPSRSEPAPRREESPRAEPRREESRPSPPVRSDPPPQRSEPRNDPPRRETSPAPSRDPGPLPSREDNRPRRDPGSVPSDPPQSRREEPRSPARETGQTPRRDNNPDNASPRRDDRPSPRRDTGPSSEPRSAPREDQRPTRDSGVGREQRPQRDTTPDNRGSDQGPGNIFNRRNPTNSHDPIGDPLPNDQGSRNDRADRTDRNNDRRTGPGPVRSGEVTVRGSSRSENISPLRDRARDIFTRSQEGRYYNNGVLLRRGYYTPYREVGYYYPNYTFYPYYYPTYSPSVVYFSPYSFYYGVCAPYIYRRHTYFVSPSVVWIDVPIYVNNQWNGWYDDRRTRDDDYYLSRSRDYFDADSVSDRGLRDAIDDIRDAFHYGSIEHLVNLVDPQIKMAVFLKGKYEYSLSSNDYLDMTRDAMRNMDTIQFDITRLRKRAASVYVASGKHVYRNRDGEKRTVYVSFVLEKLRDRWTLTQVGTSPDRIQEP